MHSWRALPSSPFQESGHITSAFLRACARDYRSAAGYVSRLPYGRIRELNDVLAVMREQRGTCSTKHALLRRLALEQGIDVQLMLGIFEMSGDNTPGVGSVLENHGLKSLPEAHCYLCIDGQRIDATRDFDAEPLTADFEFLHEEEISAEQIGAYKTAIHREFLQRWLAQMGAGHGWDLDEVWKIREECIRALSVVAVGP
jgi:hypothetical protein